MSALGNKGMFFRFKELTFAYGKEQTLRLNSIEDCEPVCMSSEIFRVFA